MGDGLTPELLVPAFWIGLASLWIVSRDLPYWLALSIVFVRFAVPVAYFAWLYDGRWTFLDDITYWWHGTILLELGYSPFTVLFDGQGLLLLLTLSGGPHILYAWWNHLAQYLFGPHYFAPVLMNIGLTFVAGAFFYRLVRFGGFGQAYAQGLLAFFLLHWDVVAWSSIANLKDVLVLALSAAGFYCLARLFDSSSPRRTKAASVAGLLAVLFVLPWLRYYIPVLLIGAVGVWVLLKLPGRTKFAVLGAAGLGILLLLPGYIPTQYMELSPGSVLLGLVRFTLSPQPWSIEPEYTFLLLPAALHWLLFVPALGSAYLLWQRSPGAALVLVYLAVTTAVYALIPELQGPRHRVQIIFIWAWMQYHAIYLMLAHLYAKPGAPREDGDPEASRALQPVGAV